MSEADFTTRVIVGVSGASGAIYGWRLLERLRELPHVETHLILTRSGERTAFLELGKLATDFKRLAHHSYPMEDIGSRLASGSYLTQGMVIAPCSVNSMSAIRAKPISFGTRTDPPPPTKIPRCPSGKA